MPPFAVSFRRSRVQIAMIVACFLLLMAHWLAEGARFDAKNMILNAIVLCAIIGSIFATESDICHLRVDLNGNARLTFAEKSPHHARTFDAFLCPESLITPHLCCLKWRVDSHIYWQWVWHDSSDAESLRRLRVWAKFGQTKHFSPPQH